MLKVILFSIFTCVLLSATAQVQTQVIGDSVFVHSNTGTSELILQNSTDTVNGFLFNKGAGRTEFRRAIIKIDDSTYLVGADTLHLNNAGGSAWGLTGNAGTNPSVNFIGTTDNQPLVFKMNNSLSGMIGTASNYNISFGLLSLSSSTTGVRNSAFGGNALAFNTTGSYNSAQGYRTLYSNTTGYRNTAEGYEALYHNTIGNNNVAIGWNAQGWDSAGIGNTAVGNEAMNQTYSVLHIGGSYNSALGFGALGDNFNNNYNIGIGKNAGLASTSSNTFYISDSTYHMYFKLDSAAGNAPSVIGKDANGFWHTYANSGGGSATPLVLTTTGTSGAATLANNTLNIPNYTPAIATANTTGVVSAGLGLAIDSAGKLSTTIGLLKPGSVPYAGPGGTLIQDTTGLVYDGNNLQVGHSGFYNTVGLSLNGGRGRLSASGFGLTIGTTGGQPMDASKSISFYNSSTLYGSMSMRSAYDSTLRFLSSMEFVPGVTNKYNLGSSANQWDTVFAKQLYINGALASGGAIPSLDSVVHHGDSTTMDIVVNGSTVGLGSGNIISNTAIGPSALHSNTSGYRNTGVGALALYFNTTGYRNTAVGDSALYFNTTGYRNVALGQNALNFNTTGFENTALGTNALHSNTTGSFNAALGMNALYANATGSYNVALGEQSLQSNTSGSSNIGIGQYALALNSSGIGNTAIGYQSLMYLSSGNYNIGLGYNAKNVWLSSNNTMYISDSTTHFYFNLDSASSTASSVIGKDAGGLWHTYQAPTYGTATLSSGTVTISTRAVKAGAKIFVSVNTPGGTQGFLSAPTGSIVDGTSFVINSTSATDNSTVNYQIINP